MSMLDDARDFHEHPPTHMEDCPDGYQQICGICHRRIDRGHESGCFTLTMPRIVAALEAAERLAAISPEVNLWSHSGNDYWCYACDALLSSYNGQGEQEHESDCPHQALVKALESR